MKLLYKCIGGLAAKNMRFVPQETYEVSDDIGSYLLSHFPGKFMRLDVVEPVVKPKPKRKSRAKPKPAAE